MSALGDAVPGGNSDLLYSGETGESVLSMQFYRNKASEFQNILNQLDAGQSAALLALYATEDPELYDYLSSWLADFDAKRGTFKATAQAINLGAEAINAAGGRFPQLSIPSGLGLIPLLPAVAIGAIATAATLITWGVVALRGLNERLKFAQALDATTDPDKRATLAQAVTMSDVAAKNADSSPLSSVAGIVKWGALAFGAFLIWKAYSARNSAG